MPTWLFALFVVVASIYNLASVNLDTRGHVDNFLRESDYSKLNPISANWLTDRQNTILLYLNSYPPTTCSFILASLFVNKKAGSVIVSENIQETYFHLKMQNEQLYEAMISSSPILGLLYFISPPALELKLKSLAVTQFWKMRDNPK